MEKVQNSSTSKRSKKNRGGKSSPVKPVTNPKDMSKKCLEDGVAACGTSVSNVTGDVNSAASCSTASFSNLSSISSQSCVSHETKDCNATQVAVSASHDLMTNTTSSNDQTVSKMDSNIDKSSDSITETHNKEMSKKLKDAKKTDINEVKNVKEQSQASHSSQSFAVTATEEGDTPAVQKTKGELRRERREKQEAQRALKQGAGKQNNATSDSAAKSNIEFQQKQNKQQQRPKQPESDPVAATQSSVKKPQQASAPKKQEQTAGPTLVQTDPKIRVPDSMQLDDEKLVNRMEKKLEKQNVPKRSQAQKKVSLFRHLHQYEYSTSLTSSVPLNSSDIHCSVLQLGLQYAYGVVAGSNSRCIALLKTLKQVIEDYETPENKELARDMDSYLSPFISFLNQCRQQSVSMGNAIKHLKRAITNTPCDCPEEKAKANLINVVDKFYQERIFLAAKAISEEYAFKKIEDGDVILVYACSYLVRKTLLYAHSVGKKFSVIVIDSRPKFEGRVTLRHLNKQKIECSYALVNSVSHAMKKATKVFLGAHAILANGYLMSRIGTAEICMMAKSFNIPVVVCCETYKFYDRVHTDSFFYNELGDPDDLVKCGGRTEKLSEWRNTNNLYLMNLLYDITPHELISMVVTDVGMIPPTSVPIVLRVKNPEGY